MTGNVVVGNVVEAERSDELAVVVGAVSVVVVTGASSTFTGGLSSMTVVVTVSVVVPTIVSVDVSSSA